MQIIKSVKQMQEFSLRAKSKGKTIGFVPTMGYLHEGHASLLRQSKKENDVSVLSIFVNPTQFGPSEDFDRYPRNFKNDKMLAQKYKVDTIFYPSVVGMYPAGFETHVAVDEMSNVLCGKFRPGHFKGVATVVLKLLNIVLPTVMYLGQKDAQQAILLTKMVLDLNVPTKIKVLPTVREKDGLAMSSRNSYLSAEERSAAPVIYKSLIKAKNLIAKGERNPQTITQEIQHMIANRFPAKFDYVECVDAENLKPFETLKGNILIAIAAWFGKTRLIDNIVVKAK